ncbi:MAG: 23S rRNA (adenine(2503)-C(2))-methyltransferase RlmN [Planctomycetota bacterium]|nr:23S rRNA (adenine(2503)-C(2))-methyltransferase RlmN [Planctomycetota bacterium]
MTAPADQEHLLDSPPQQLDQNLAAWCQHQGSPDYRGRQVRQHLIEGRILDPADMTSLPQPLRQSLAEGILSAPFRKTRIQRSNDGTMKFYFLLHDGLAVESVWIPSGDRGTLCVSSQVGCAAACTFCATGTMKLARNLHPREILGQWLAVQQATTAEGLVGVTQLVFMGMGEPLHNYEAVSRTIDWLSSPTAFQFSPRRITVSTVGIVPKIRQLITDHPQVRLALSLHSAIESTRNEIVPLNSRHGLDELSQLLDEIKTETRRISLEYVVLPGVNDSAEEAEALAAFAWRSGSHINLLPFHPFEGAPYQAATEQHVTQFLALVEANYDGPVTARRSRGLDIDGACGQLVLKTRPDPSS